ncbi:MAG: hypothetical protein M1822_000117 [Bathelium mastoideum]|nr:MAG: hypothetical protein M1822_000117 [Bathelium mastoideum]
MEVLAHIGAPSRRESDDRYEAQARAYADFRPATSTRSPKSAVSLSDTADDHSTEFIEETQFAVAALQTDLLTSSLREPVGRVTQANDDEGQAAMEEDVVYLGQASCTPSQAGHSPSSPQADVHNRSLLSSGDTNEQDEPAPYMAVRQGKGFGVAFVGYPNQTESAGRGNAGEVIDLSSPSPDLDTLQMRQSLFLPRESPLQKAKDIPIASPVRQNESGTFYELYNHVGLETPKDQDQADRKNHASRSGLVLGQQPDAQLKPVFPDSEEVSSVIQPAVAQPRPQPQLEPQQQSTIELESPSIDFREHPYGFSVDYPPIGMSREMPSQLNGAATILKLLITTPELQGKYNPIERRRELGPYERAKWSVDTSRWSPGIQLYFWRWLQRHGKDGRLGWSIAFWREHDKHADARTICESLGMVTVFCWSEVIEHIYLAMYMASKTKIVGTGATLRTGPEGELIVRMR